MATVIFDFDDTIFDTAKLKESIFGILSDSGLSRERIEKSYHDSKSNSGNYSFESHLRLLNNEDVVQGFDLAIESFLNLNLEVFIFPEVKDTLKQLSQNNTLVLITKGTHSFQTKKISASGIEKYFHSIHIIEGEKQDFLALQKLPSPVYFINDKESENEKIRRLFPEFIFIDARNRSSWKFIGE